MPLISVNLKDVDTSMPLFDPGVYDLEAAKVTYVPRNGDAVPRVDIMFKAANAPTEDRRRLTKRFDLEGDFLWSLKAFMEAAGLNSDITELDTDSLVGAVAKTVVTQNTYVDKTTKETRMAANIQKFLKSEA